MNVITMLKQDHRKVRGLFRRFDLAGDHAAQRRQTIAAEAFDDLGMHTKLEQEIFYPEVQAGDLVAEALEEHKLVERLIDELKGMSIESEEYKAKFKVLTENVQHHIEEEEGEMFPSAQAEMSPRELNDLGSRMAERKRALRAPGLVHQTYKRAKRMVSEAFEAFSGSASNNRPRRTSKARAAHDGPAKRRTSGAGQHARSRTRAARAVAKSKQGARKSIARKAARTLSKKKTGRNRQ